MPTAMKVLKSVMKASAATAAPKSLPKAVAKKAPKAAPKAGASKSKLTTTAVAEHERAHEKLVGKGCKTAEDVLEELKKMPKNEQEQIWKQLLRCNMIWFIHSLFIFTC